MERGYRLEILLVAAGVLLMSGLAVGQELGVDANEVDATGGVLLPSPSITDIHDATGLAINPGNLGLLESWNLTYVGAWLTDQQRLAGQGHGFFLGIPVGPVGLGIGVEPLFPSAQIANWQGFGQRTRFSLGLAVNLKRIIGLGIAYRTFWFERYDGIHALDLGLTVHPLNHLVFSFVFRDVNTPKFQYKPKPDGLDITDNAQYVAWYESDPLNHRAPRQFHLGLTIRPLGSDRLALGGELKYLHGEIDYNLHNNRGTFSRTDVSALISGIPIDGISLRFRFTAEGVRSGRETNLILDGSVALDLPNVGVGASTYGQVSPGSLKGYQGTSWFASIHGDVAPALTLPRPLRSAHMVVLDLEDSLNSYSASKLSRVLDRIEHDKSVDMVLFRPDPKTISLAQAGEIRERIKRLQKTGRKVYCHMSEGTSAVYYACSGADHVWVNPAGGIRLAGLKMQLIYYKDLLDKFGVKAEVVRIGDYKSAPETYTRSGPSEFAVEQTEYYLDSVYRHLVESINKDRKLKGVEAAKKIIEDGPFTATEALERGLVDAVVPADELDTKISKLTGSLVYFDNEYHKQRVRRRHYIDAPAVAVVHIDGDIVDGESIEIPFLNIKMTGSKTMTETLRAIAADSRMKAVILRINSPGGSSLASDIIWREVMALRKVKPVIAAMGSVAASGAYYIASAANEIYADPTTLTGSIGIYYGKADLSGLLDKVGVNVTTYKRGEHADAQSWVRPYTEKEKKRMMKQLKEYYNLFLSRIVAGRGRELTVQKVDKLGRGRIWSGADALQHRLVDSLGGYSSAVDRARTIAGIPKQIPVFHYPKQSDSLLVRLLTSAVTMVKGTRNSSIEQMVKVTGMERILKPIIPFATHDPNMARARLPFVSVDE